MKSIMDKKNVVGMATGEKWINGKPTGQKATLVFVEKKEPLSDLDPKDVIESSIDGIPTDVVGKTGRLNAMVRVNPRKRIRPVLAGLSVSHRKVTAGTIGAVCIDKDKDIVILSNNHVLANSNNASAGDLIYQPGTYDNKKLKRNAIGYLKDFVRLRNGVNQDSAIAKLKVRYKTQINRLGKIRGVRNAVIRLRVYKSGCTTGLTKGRVIAKGGTFKVWYTDKKAYTITGCIVTNYMSDGGDSGSLLVDKRRWAMGLLFAGSNTVTLYSPLKRVLAHYGLRILK